jgi:hypothetical protein
MPYCFHNPHAFLPAGFPFRDSKNRDTQRSLICLDGFRKRNSFNRQVGADWDERGA